MPEKNRYFYAILGVNYWMLKHDGSDTPTEGYSPIVSLSPEGSRRLYLGKTQFGERID